MVNYKTDEIKQYLKRVEKQCFEKSQILDENERLDEIISDLQRKNHELQNIAGNNMYTQAQEFKSRGFRALNRKNKRPDQSQQSSGFDDSMHDGHLITLNDQEMHQVYGSTFNTGQSQQQSINVFKQPPAHNQGRSSSHSNRSYNGYSMPIA